MELNRDTLRELGVAEKETLINPLPNVLGKNPDNAAKGLQLSRKTGVDALLAADHLPQLNQDNSDDTWEGIVRNTPALARAMQQPVNAAMMHDDVGNLGLIERLFKKSAVSQELAKQRKRQRANPFSSMIEQGGGIVSPQEYSVLIKQIAADNPFMTPPDVHAAAKRAARPVSGALMRDGAVKGKLVEDALAYMGAAGTAGLHDLAAAGAKLVDAFNPFTVSDEDLASFYKDDPERLRYYREQSAAMGLSRFAREQTTKANETMANVLPSAKARYGGLVYATTDSDESALLSPVKVVSDALRSLPSSLAMGVTVFLTRGAATRVEAEALAGGASAEVARKAGIDAAKSMAIKFGAASEGLIGYAQQANQTQNIVEGLGGDILAQSPMYQNLIEQGFDHYAAAIYTAHRTGEQSGIGAGVVDAGVNALVGKHLGKLIAEGGSLAPRVGKGFGLEAFTEFWQSGGEQISENLALQQNVDQSKQLSDHVIESMLQGLAVGGLTGGVFAGVLGSNAKAIQAEQSTQILQALTDAAQASKVLGRDSATFQSFIESANEDGDIQNVFLDANTLAQSGLSEQLAQVSPSVAEQLPVALASGGVVRIPVAEYMAQVAPQTYAQSLINDLRTEAEGYSKNEADAYFQSGAMKELEESAQRVIKESTRTTAFEESKSRVKQLVLDELNALGRFTSQKNELDATLIAVRSSIRAAQLGVTPEEFFKQYVLKVTAEKLTGETLGQEGNTKTEVVSGRWLRALRSVSGRNQDYSPHFELPTIAKEMGVTGDKLELPTRVMRQIFSKHADVPRSVVLDLPKLLSDPLFVFGHKDGGLNVVIEIKTAKGEPIVVGVRDGRVRTITPYNDTESLTGNDRLARNLAEAEKGNKKVYHRNEKAPDKSEANSLQQIRTNPDGLINKRPKNIVTRDDIVKKYGDAFYQSEQPGSRRGAFNPANNTIALLKGADLSTFLHESAHYFFETDIAIAASILEENDIFGVSTMSKGKQQILQDVSALLKWHGIEGDIQQQVSAWYNMDFEEKRVYHERTAESFEKYLYEGKAPSIELMPVFQRFSQWMKSVYSSVKEFLVRNPEAGKINNEVRAIFDRMLATELEIKQAQAARSMFPLFQTAEEAGLTEEEFFDYQQTNEQSTTDAVQELQTKGLRDMKWLRNAQSRELKRLQKLSAEQRAEVRRVVRTEVVGEPLYQAWMFLTGRMTDEDKLPVEQKKNSSAIVDPEIDSLFTAIAKLGGLKFDEVMSQWGVDPKEKIKMPIFGKPVLHKSGGRSIDSMVEALAEEGYLALDENGKADSAELEERFDAELRGNTQFSQRRNYSLDEQKRAGEGLDLGGIKAGRIDYDSLVMMDLPKEVIEALEQRKMTARKGGLHPDILSEILPEWSSGDELVRALAAAVPMKEEIERRTDVRMLEMYAELATPDAVQRAADVAIHNLARAKLLEIEYQVLSKATGEKRLLIQAAKAAAEGVIARLKVRDIRPAQYTAAEARAARAVERETNLATKAREKKNQILSFYLARGAYAAQEEVEAGVRYQRKFDSKAINKRIDAGYLAQINALREQFNFKQRSLKEIDKRVKLAAWLAEQVEIGLVPDIDPRLVAESEQTHYKDATVEEFRGLMDSIKQLEHLGRLKSKLMAAKNQRDFEKVKAVLLEVLKANAKGSRVLNREPANGAERLQEGAEKFLLYHLKASSLARVFDGGQDGGIWWQTLIRPANEAADRETELTREAAEKLTAILKPVLKGSAFWRGLEGKGKKADSVGRSLNKMQRIVIALNMGNAGNMQRLLDGENWSREQVMPILESLNAVELNAVQQIWDYYESFRPQVAALETKFYGKEPEWIEPVPLTVRASDGVVVNLRGGYYPIKYDSKASARSEELASAETAKQAMTEAYSAATVRRSFAKARAGEVHDRPLSYTMEGLFSSSRELIHYLSWSEWVVDTQRIVRDKDMQNVMRDAYGATTFNELKNWVNDVAKGDQSMSDAVARAMTKIRANVSAASLTFNAMTGLLQLTGFTNAATRNGLEYQARAMAKLAANPLSLIKEIRAKSKYMSFRTDTMFQELNEVNNLVRGSVGFSDFIHKRGYVLIQVMQQQVDAAAWWGAYEKAIADGHVDDTAVAIADQVVRDTQGSGLWSDLSAVQRNKYLKLFAVFYNYMNTVLNTIYVQGKTAKNKGKFIADMMILTVLIPAMTAVIRSAFVPSNDDEGEDWLWKILREIGGSAVGLFVLTRELQALFNVFTDDPLKYQGPAGLRPLVDLGNLVEQSVQGEADEAFVRASVNMAGSLFAVPSVAINKGIKGYNALEEGKTDNPAALVFGYRD